MNNTVNEGISICYRVANELKTRYPNDIMNIKSDTIIPFSSALRRKARSKSISGYAYYLNTTPHRVVIKQKVLSERECLRTKVKNQSDRVMLYGNFALTELICHELAHHRTKGHAKGFKIKYNKFLNYMVNMIISGELYPINSGVIRHD